MLKKNDILIFEIISTIFIMILGVILHFTFKWSNGNVFVGTFSPINESVWEHLKLLFFPMLISTIIVYFYKGINFSNYLCAKVIGIILSISFTIIFFYTYTGIIGKNFAIVDISSFFIAVLLGEYVAYQKINSKSSCNNIIAISLDILKTALGKENRPTDYNDAVWHMEVRAWDLCAATAILREVGGNIVGDNGKPISIETLTNPSARIAFIASGNDKLRENLYNIYQEKVKTKSKNIELEK